MRQPPNESGLEKVAKLSGTDWIAVLRVRQWPVLINWSWIASAEA